MNTEFKIILNVKKLESHFPEVILETKTARFRDKSEGFVDFISSAEKYEGDPSELLKQNKEMREMLNDIYLHMDAVGRRLPEDSDFKQGLVGRAKNIKQFLTPKN